MTLLTSRTVVLHPDYPEWAWIVVEQAPGEPVRMAYEPATGTFRRTEYLSLIHARGFTGAYGWIGGTGAPPDPHFDSMLLTRGNPQPGDVVLATICGVFFRGDGDHKFVAMDEAWRARAGHGDFDLLDEATQRELRALYPVVGEGEGWFGAEVARRHLVENEPTHD